MAENLAPNNSVSDIPERKISDNPVLLAIGGLGSIASIVGLLAPLRLFDLFKESISIQFGAVVLVASVFLSILYLVLLQSNKAHHEYYANLEKKVNDLKNENKVLVESNDDLSKYPKMLKAESDKVLVLTSRNKELNNKLEDYESLECVILGILKSGKPYSFRALRHEIDDSFSDQYIQIALSGLGDKITATNPKSSSSEYIINNAR
ncbi:hypothetical protein VCR12J2_80017 [Vibrio coralliirubri]|uniref:hypothetical protein n=1 Tax=Vibrio TaxID=662 RepID=UPI00062EBBF4|nr:MULTISPECIES: hypothetical protein [Vibrio]RLQ19906.1 hypothetical protein AYK60_07500 [Vibrio sp. SBT000027]CDU06690.1 hypothetical protein VCR12J2_80017 [Vibrio coralliirubri]